MDSTLAPINEAVNAWPPSCAMKIAKLASGHSTTDTTSATRPATTTIASEWPVGATDACPSTA
jgi:hypothetical protein